MLQRPARALQAIIIDPQHIECVALHQAVTVIMGQFQGALAQLNRIREVSQIQVGAGQCQEQVRLARVIVQPLG